jgi:asparagine synthase (glutamine-hydrolysing)
MCGIAGKLYFDRERAVDPALLTRMHQVLAHRGPDDSGIYHDGPVGLAHRRLAIIDLSPGGHQPMASADGRVWIVFNGEIYNFLELRAELERQGVRFRSRSDTEVILALYDRDGVDFVRALRGMFALALWDGRTRRLVLARDRAGKKPLLYYADAERFVFGSEAKALLEDPEVPVAMDPVAIHHYLTFGYVPAPRSAFRDISKVPPAHYLVVDNGVVRTERYWELSYEPKRVASEAALCEELREQLLDAVRVRLISDVPLGAFLSGGIDSSAVVAMMSRLSSKPVKTFSIGFEDDEFNELPHARLVAQRFGTDHHEFIVKPDALEVLPELVWHYNEPYADSSAIPTYYLAKLARQHVTVALNGDAGDENFAGYDRYLGMQLAGHYDRLPRAARAAIQAGVAALPARGGHRGLVRRAKRFVAAMARPAGERYGSWISFFSNEDKTTLYTDGFADAVRGLDAFGWLERAAARVPASDPLDRTLGMDVATYLADDLLVKVDIASMAHALEARSPMVDHRFMEFAAALPASMKLRGRTKKYLLKAALRGILPDAIIDRPKMGFGVPIADWLRRELRDLAHETLLSSRAQARGLFRPAEVRGLLAAHADPRTPRHFQLWNLLALELWFQRFLDDRPRRTG